MLVIVHVLPVSSPLKFLGPGHEQIYLKQGGLILKVHYIEHVVGVGTYQMDAVSSRIIQCLRDPQWDLLHSLTLSPQD